MERRIGLMGGTFDPIHWGHLILAQEAWQCFGLETVLFVTAADPPHKVGLQITSGFHRLAMTMLAIQGNENFDLSTIEFDRSGPSYTIDTLKAVLEEFGADTKIYLLLGADEGRALMSWRDPYGIRDLATIVVANRPGCSVSEATAELPGDLAESIVPLEIPGIDISSTDLRERVRSGRTIRYLVPDLVREYIIEKGLYRGKE